MRMSYAITFASSVALAIGAGCRSAVVVTPQSKRSQTVVTVEERPTTNPSDKGLVVRDKR